MKIKTLSALLLTITMLLTACGVPQSGPNPDAIPENAVEIVLSDNSITVDGESAGNETSAAVYTANDIVYYESGKDFTYGEGTEADAHNADEAAAHTVVHITQPGVYSITGTLSRGQIAVDLGDDAKSDPTAVVTLILNSVDITCEVAPAVIFYNVYECGSDDVDTASKDVDTSAAGANVVIADGTVNTVNGSYVARIYKSSSVVLNEDGTAVEDAKKLHKYDGAFYSKRSMNISGGEKGTGVLNIHADNEGLDSELHLTINGGVINIFSGNDGINTNEDGVSVTTMNGGTLTITVTGETGEGDGIDSNGWLVINGGTVIASACASSPDAGIDSDMGIHINGGTVIASGHMLDRIEDGGQTYAVFSFAKEQSGDAVCLRNESGKSILEVAPENSYSILLVSSPDLTSGTYTLWSGSKQLAGQSGGAAGGTGMPGMPGGFDGGNFPTPPEGGATPPNGQQPPEPPDGEDLPEWPNGEGFPERPDGEGEGGRGPGGSFGPNGADTGEVSSDFTISDGANMFSNVTEAE